MKLRTHLVTTSSPLSWGVQSVAADCGTAVLNAQTVGLWDAVANPSAGLLWGDNLCPKCKAMTRGSAWRYLYEVMGGEEFQQLQKKRGLAASE